MRYFFINLVLSIFFILPDWLLKIVWPLKRQRIRNEYLDYQAATFIKIIDIFGYKIDTENFTNTEIVKYHGAQNSRIHSHQIVWYLN